jgi:hypothetical protein
MVSKYHCLQCSEHPTTTPWPLIVRAKSAAPRLRNARRSPATSSPGHHTAKSVHQALTNVDFLRQSPQSHSLAAGDPMELLPKPT